MRVVAENWLNGEKIISENTPFLFVKDKKQYIKAAPMAYIPNLKDFILQHLEYVEE